MASDISFFFNSSIQTPRSGYFESIGDYCLTPVRYLNNGHNYIIEDATSLVNEDKWDFTASWPWLKTALAVICFVPGTIVGTLAKAFALMIDSDMRGRQAFVQNYQMCPQYSVEIPQPDPQKNLDAYLIELKGHNKALCKEISKNKVTADLTQVVTNSAEYSASAVALWQTQKMIVLADAVMECMVRATQVFKRDLEQEGKRNLEAMAYWLETQAEAPVWSKYCYKFFKLVQPYYKIRACTFVTDNPYEEGHLYPHDGFIEGVETWYTSEGSRVFILNPQAEKPYFQLGTPQRKWRDYYNFFCDQFKDIFPYMTDPRFHNWAQRDMSRGTFSGSPDTIPT